MSRTFHRITHSHGAVLALALGLLPGLAWADVAAEVPVTTQIVDLQTRLAKGPHPGFRPNHAKGIVAHGTFTPAPQAADVSRAPHFKAAGTPVVVRFSNAGGVPTIADASPKAMPKGMAVRFRLADGSETDIVAFSVNRFPVPTPELFRDMLRAVAASGPDAPKPTPLEQFLDDHPTAKAFVKQPKPVPASFTTQTYHGVNAFRFENAQRVQRYGRYRIVPLAGEQFMSEAQAAESAPDVLMHELAARLQRQPAAFRLLVQVAAEGDVVDDPTVVWPDERPLVELGTLTLTRVAADSLAEERALAFNPLLLTDGIAPSADPVLLARPAAYAVGLARRFAAQ